MPARLRRLLPLLLGILPVVAFVQGGRRTALGRESPDLLGHLWTIWHADQESLTRTQLLAWPEGVDLLPILGGWADIAIGGALVPALGVVGAWNATMALYLLMAGAGGWVLARGLGTGPGVAVVGGLVLQLDPATLHHLYTGRAEQVGIGVLALFLGTGLIALRQASRWPPVALSLFGALSLAVAWEYGLFVALFGAVLLIAAPGAPARRRIALGGLGAVALALPMVIPFVLRSAEAPQGRFADEWALRTAQNSLVLLGPQGWGGALPAVLPTLTLLAMPWTAKSLDRRLKTFLYAVLVLTALLSLGPEPHLSAPPQGQPAAWAPFTWFHHIPGLGRYQTPIRLLVPWSVLAAGASALLVGAALRRKTLMGTIVTAVLLLGTLNEVRGLLPRAQYTLPTLAGIERLAQDPHPGAVYDLPSASRGGRTIDNQLAQMTHARPIRHHSLQVYMEGDTPPAVDPFLTWTGGREGGSTSEGQRMAVAVSSLQERGFGWVVLYSGRQRAAQETRLANRVRTLLGEPAHKGREWTAWRVPQP